MAAGAWKMFGAAGEALLDSSIDWESDSFRMALVTSSYTLDLTDTAWSDISTNEVANGNGYATHGKAITPTLSRSGQVVTLDCDDQSWTSATFSAKHAVIVRDADDNGALASSDLPLLICDLDTGGGSLSPSAGTLSITISASGLYAFTLAS